MPNAKLCHLVLLIIAAGCTTQPAKDPKVASAAGSDVQCHTDHPTGTLIGKTVCTTQADRNAQQAEMDDLKHVVSQGGCVRSGGEGC